MLDFLYRTHVVCKYKLLTKSKKVKSQQVIKQPLELPGDVVFVLLLLYFQN